ncbi:EAL domain-containing protein [Aciduricibacillus chroicocephali]|uniref:EAL domain-containing protein n=1 Tax=Aciduricibacillus chroicocephali TaxID=3054939 RepID=A0ABY9KUE6_9BACI|nr:EAL domain-containing protein [Bacillaceae bacterium 44XB]
MGKKEFPSLDEVLEKRLYHHHFQPIICMDSNAPHGYECLLRTPFAGNPQKLFRKAILERRLFELDISSIIHAIDHINRHADLFESGTKFYLNVYPSTLVSPAFIILLKDMITASPFDASSFVLEINEDELISHAISLKPAVKRLRSIGVQVALDDIGASIEHFDTMVTVRPDIIKLDKYFANDLAASEHKKKHITMLSHYSRKNNMQIVLEGIETHADLEAAVECGIPLIQGYLLGRPDDLLKIFSNKISQQ